MKKIMSIILFIILITFMLCLSCCLSGCNNESTKSHPHETTNQQEDKQSTDNINQTEVTTMIPETANKTEVNHSPTELTPEFYEIGAAISRLTEAPVTVEIGKTGVTIDLSYHGWPTVIKDENGTLYAAASLRREHVDPFGATAFFESKDNGLTWSEPRIIHDSPVDDRDVGLVYIGGGKIVATFFTIGSDYFLDGGTYSTSWGKCTSEQKSAKINEWNSYTSDELSEFNGRFVMLSEDYGKTWSAPIRVPFSSPHGPALLNDGKTLICSGVSGKTFSTYTSNNYGKTWSTNAKVTLPDLPSGYSYSEPYVIQLSDGSFLAGIRSEKSGVIGTSYSIWTMKSNDGKNWTTAQKIPTVVGAPPHFLELSNGAVLLTYSYRVGSRGVRGCLSYDGGKTWDTEKFVISNNTSRNNNDLGYPSTVELADGTLITVYYQPYGNDYPSSLLYTKWKLVPSD